MHRLAKGQSHRPPDFLSRYGSWLMKTGSEGIEAMLRRRRILFVRGICGAHGGHDTDEVHTIRRIGGGHGLRWGGGGGESG